MSAMKTRENRLRRKADRLGLRLSKSRRRDPDALDHGMYAILDIESGGTTHPMGVISPHCLTLDEVEELLTEYAS